MAVWRSTIERNTPRFSRFFAIPAVATARSEKPDQRFLEVEAEIARVYAAFDATPEDHEEARNGHCQTKVAVRRKRNGGCGQAARLRHSARAAERFSL